MHFTIPQHDNLPARLGISPYDRWTLVQDGIPLYACIHRSICIHLLELVSDLDLLPVRGECGKVRHKQENLPCATSWTLLGYCLVCWYYTHGYARVCVLCLQRWEAGLNASVSKQGSLAYCRPWLCILHIHSFPTQAI
jgi:hypothetical protein